MRQLLKADGNYLKLKVKVGLITLYVAMLSLNLIYENYLIVFLGFALIHSWHLSLYPSRGNGVLTLYQIRMHH